jgi:hypothetical protein|nr:MAG TPA: Intrinsic membrane protein pufX protein, quinone exchange, photosynthesis [Caudoviricetes sp.]
MMTDLGFPVLQIFGVWLLSCAILLLVQYLNSRKQPNPWAISETDHDQ